MFAKQTLRSASLVAALAGSMTAHAESTPEPPASGEVHEAPTGRFVLGLGYTTDDQLSFGAAVVQDNLLHTGNHLSLHATLSARRQLFLARFETPGGVGVDIYNDRRVLPGLSRQAAGGTLTLSRKLDDHVRGYIGYRLEQVTVEGDAPYIARGGILPQQPVLISALRAGLEYNTLDEALAPSRGTSIGAAMEAADSHLGSDIDVMRVKAWANHHQPLGPLVLHVGGLFESAIGPRGVPRTERVFFDGNSEVRGYTPGALGPSDGGNYKLLGRAELELPLSRGLSLVTFADAGSVVDTMGRGSLGASAGVGLLWRSPVGPMRFDLAFTRDGDHSFVIGILGGTF